jgi:hypothetical protein
MHLLRDRREGQRALLPGSLSLSLSNDALVVRLDRFKEEN